jgi:hypothetical protein
MLCWCVELRVRGFQKKEGGQHRPGVDLRHGIVVAGSSGSICMIKGSAVRGVSVFDSGAGGLRIWTSPPVTGRAVPCRVAIRLHSPLCQPTTVNCALCIRVRTHESKRTACAPRCSALWQKALNAVSEEDTTKVAGQHAWVAWLCYVIHICTNACAWVLCTGMWLQALARRRVRPLLQAAARRSRRGRDEALEGG